MYLDDPRFRVAASRRILYREGCDSGVGGQVSERGAEGEVFWASPFGYFDETLPSSVQKNNFELEILEGGNTALPPNPAIEFHAAIYRERPDVRAVIHTHSHWATALCAKQQFVGMYNDAATLLAGEQALFEDDPTRPLAEGKRVAAALGEKSVLLMKCHGPVFAADSLELATKLAWTFEEMAKLQVTAEAIDAMEHPDDYVQVMKENYRKYSIPQWWAANLRRLRQSDPEVFDFILDSEFAAHGYSMDTPM